MPTTTPGVPEDAIPAVTIAFSPLVTPGLNLVLAADVWDTPKSTAPAADSRTARIEPNLRWRIVSSLTPQGLSQTPEAVTVSSSPEEVEAVAGIAVVNLCRALRLVSVCWNS